jgi:hypothetical protein
MIGRGDEAYIYPDRLCRSDSLELTLLQDAQKHRLALLWQITDLIEKQCSPIFPLESAELSSEGPSEDPFSCPNSSLSIKFGLNAAQLTSTNGFLARLLAHDFPLSLRELPETARGSREYRGVLPQAVRRLSSKLPVSR